jgi:hypothetical protein
MLEGKVTAGFVAGSADRSESPSYGAGGLVDLQRLASGICVAIAPAPTWVTHQVYFVAGVKMPWRLLETTRCGARQKKLMLCFDSLERIWQSVEERRTWQREDEAFVERHMTTPGGFPGVTGDWVPSKDFDFVFGPQRKAMRLALCATQPDCLVTLGER